jgi:uncharacterized protein (DUF433 family)
MKLDRITSNPARMNGHPCIRNLRLTVRRVIDLWRPIPTERSCVAEFLKLEDEDIRQAPIYASTYLDARTGNLHYSARTTNGSAHNACLKLSQL